MMMVFAKVGKVHGQNIGKGYTDGKVFIGIGYKAIGIPPHRGMSAQQHSGRPG